MNSREFKEFIINVLSEKKGRASALTPVQINDELYRRHKQRMESATARDAVIVLFKQGLVKRHQPGHSKSTFYYWID